MAIFDFFSKKSKAQKKKERDQRNLQRYNERQEKIDNDIRTAQQVYKKKSIIDSLKFETYTKRLVGVIVLAGIVDLQLTYVLAFMGKDQIVETLSGQVCATILGTALIYMIRAYFDTKAEKKNDQPRIDRMFANDIINKVQEIVNASDIPVEQDAIKEAIPKEILAVIDDEDIADDEDDEIVEEVMMEEDLEEATKEIKINSKESQAGDDA